MNNFQNGIFQSFSYTFNSIENWKYAYLFWTQNAKHYYKTGLRFESRETQKPKIELPNKTLVGVEPTKKKEINESTKLPKPTGWRILVLPFKQKEKTKGGIILADDTIERSQVASTCGLVLSMGPHCYDKERYPEGPWCKKGDWIVFARYAGSRIKIDGGEIRLLNDDEVLATVENPEDIFHEF